MAIKRTLFAEDWYLDAVAPGQWQRLEAGKPGNGGELVLTETGRLGGKPIFSHAPLSYRMGPMYDFAPEITTAKRLSSEHALCEELIAQIPDYASFVMNFDWRIINALPFHWAGYELLTRYTYVLDDLSDLDGVWDGFTSSARRAIRKAEKQVEVVEGTAAQLWELYLETSDAQNRATGYKGEHLERLCAAVAEQGVGEILLALDADGNAHASILVIWGDECAYYLVGGTSHTYRNSGAMSLIMWEGIQRSSKHVPVFDFEGSMSPGIERFLRSFGARQAPYIQVRNASAAGTAAKTALDARRAAVKQVSKLRSRFG
ncbi:MAG: GNAT family N-acetyltransferase [Acidimicrobiales bacterium]